MALAPGADTRRVEGTVRVAGSQFDPQPGNNVLVTAVDLDGTVTVLRQGYAGPPVLLPIGDQQAVEGQPLTLSARAIDPDPTRTLTYILVAGNPPVSSIGQDTGLFRYTPTSALPRAGFTINVTDTSPWRLIDFRAFSVAVANGPPVVMAGGDAAVAPGRTLSRTGSFTDGGAGPWTATVDYGDGGGPEPLDLNADKTFAL